MLGEYSCNSGQSRKYGITKIHEADFIPKQRKKVYDGQVEAASAKIWQISDYRCGQRFKPLFGAELDRLRKPGEIEIWDELALKLKMMSSATIDGKLRHKSENLCQSRSKSGPKPGYLLKQKIPIKLTEWDTSKVGYMEVDLAVHRGLSPLGGYTNTLSSTEISSGWSECEAIIGRCQEHSSWVLEEIRQRAPFEWEGLDLDRRNYRAKREWVAR